MNRAPLEDQTFLLCWPPDRANRTRIPRPKASNTPTLRGQPRVRLTPASPLPTEARWRYADSAELRASLQLKSLSNQ